MKGQTGGDTIEWVKGEMETTQWGHFSLPSSLFTKFKGRVQGFNIPEPDTENWIDDILKALLAPQVIKFLCPAVTEA